MAAATLVHPWNRDLCEDRGRIVRAADWDALAARLNPVLA